VLPLWCAQLDAAHARAQEVARGAQEAEAALRTQLEGARADMQEARLAAQRAAAAEASARAQVSAPLGGGGEREREGYSDSVQLLARQAMAIIHTLPPYSASLLRSQLADRAQEAVAEAATRGQLEEAVARAQRTAAAEAALRAQVALG